MKMNEFMTALETHLDTQQPNYPDNAESILEVLFDAYNESSGFDNAFIKADFEELYRLMNGKPLKEIDEIKSGNLVLPRSFVSWIQEPLRVLQIEAVPVLDYWIPEQLPAYDWKHG